MGKQPYTYPAAISLVVGAVGGVSKIGEASTPAGAPGGKGATYTYSSQIDNPIAATPGSDTSGFLYPPTQVGGSGGGGGAYITEGGNPVKPAAGGSPGGGHGEELGMPYKTDGTKPGAGGGGAQATLSGEAGNLSPGTAGKGVAGLVGIMWRYK